MSYCRVHPPPPPSLPLLRLYQNNQPRILPTQDPSPNRELSQMPTMAPARRQQSAINDHFRGASSQRTPRHTSSRRATITPGSMPRYQAALPGMQFSKQHPTSAARPMISASIQDKSARPAMQPSSHSVGSPQHHDSQHKQQQPASTHWPRHPNSSHPDHQGTQPLDSNHHGGGYSASHPPAQPLDSNHHGGGYSASHSPASQLPANTLDSNHHGGGYLASQPPAQPTGSQGTHPPGPDHHGGGYSASQPLAHPTRLQGTQNLGHSNHGGGYSTRSRSPSHQTRTTMVAPCSTTARSNWATRSHSPR
jgi:hypothetical protein